jgi:hypothetical protein
VDSLPPAPPADYALAPGDIYPQGQRERDLCATASHTDWLYLGTLAVLDTGAIWFGSSATVKFSSNVPLRFGGPAMIGVTWGATIGGGWLALPKCSPTWVGETPREGAVRAAWPLALALAMLAGATAPIVNGIAIGYDLPFAWSTLEREMHLVTAAVAGFGGALLPYLIPPRTWASALELDRLRLGTDGHGGLSIGYSVAF